MAGKNPNHDDKNGIRPNAAFPREPLPKDLQKIIDKQDDWMDELYEGATPDTTDTSVRYAAYANRLRTIMLSAHRYVAYTSDIGESFRPIAHPWLVRSAYGISWAYILGDVGNEGWRAYKRNQKLLHPEGEEYRDASGKATTVTTAPGAEVQPKRPIHIPAIEDYRSVMAQRAVFQSLASMGLPAFTIHSIVKYSGKALRTASNSTIRTWGPIGLGLAAVPALPYLFDKPVEEAVEWTFYQVFRAVGGESAVGDRHSVGRQDKIKAEVKALKEKKEL
ncbi:hypothetical protein LTR10_019811 [Elasticomyces elasticus]|uniref:Mitochondrial fission process protein 1 n=1 Tax=Exophiala sideris TaxID=1016849 RepID=A0ABR0J1S6_9EURO|nr:hypothetical protein LTR10_019811 [Elasticomyces elasticus]KAK5024395.1 hypothetical protein LTS07_008686 [Exophiala sideris]KAK5030923.1 hypothetical protein LTR13_007936 [Exophiala sideris]KAK5054128.1 hypothetical protein LTR69_009090 [Exophiala sideris]KAK5179516.1 hypothetical protein LTR44_008032 [Eurotiomycetes sp. CCFEE 6388]